MKGIAPAIIIIVVILSTVVVGEGIFLNNLVVKLGPIKRSLSEMDILHGINILESIRVAFVQSLDYSFYQALYDAAKNGGYQNSGCNPYWRNYGDTSAYPNDFPKNIEARTQENLNDFGENLEVKNVDIPEYTVVMDDSGKSVKLSATTKGELQASKDLYTVSSILNFGKSFAVDISKIYSASKTEFVDKDPIGTAISDVDKNIMRTVKLDCKNNEKGYCEVDTGCSGDAVPTCEGLLNENCKGADGIFKNKIQDAASAVVAKLSDDSEKISYGLNVQDSKAEHETKTTGPIAVGGGDTDTGCGCKEKRPDCPNSADWKDEGNNICRRCPSNAHLFPQNKCQTCSGGYTPDDPKTKDISEEKCVGPVDAWQDAWTTVCKEGTYCKKFALSCEYNYKGAILAKVTATDLSDKYPVYDKNEKSVAMRNIELQFLELAGSPADYNPISTQPNQCK